jgi:hypothetical protein
MGNIGNKEYHDYYCLSLLFNVKMPNLRTKEIVCMKAAHHQPASRSCFPIPGQLANSPVTEYTGDTDQYFHL